jgi:hypothetical protein
VVERFPAAKTDLNMQALFKLLLMAFLLLSCCPKLVTLQSFDARAREILYLLRGKLQISIVKRHACTQGGGRN